MDEIYRQIANFKPRRFKHDENVLVFEVTEIWSNHATGALSPETKIIEVPSTTTWLAKETRTTKGSEESLVLRLVWTDFDSEEKMIGLPRSVLSEILTDFNLNLAFDYNLTCVSGVSTFPPHIEPDSEQKVHVFSYQPKLASVWSHKSFKDPLSQRKSATYGIILAADKQKAVLKKLLHSKWQDGICSHGMFPAFLFTFLLDIEIETTVADMKPKIQQVEKRTGYQYFESKRKAAASGQLGDLSAEMSGFATKLASAERKSKTAERLIEFILDELDKQSVTPSSTSSSGGAAVLNGNNLMRNHTNVFKERLRMQALDSSYTLKRVTVQIEALVNLIAQYDTINSTDIALSSHHDAASMKTLAFVTMFFLPGSFIAALFSTPSFDWDTVDPHDFSSIGVPSTPQFRLYWAITIPMTFITFLLYYIWLQVQNLQRKKLYHEKTSEQPVDSDQSSEEPTERELLLKKRFKMLW